MDKLINTTLKNNWFLNDKNQLCDEHHNVIISSDISNHFNEQEIELLKSKKCLCNAISPVYRKKDIYIRIPFFDEKNNWTVF